MENTDGLRDTRVGSDVTDVIRHGKHKRSEGDYVMEERGGDVTDVIHHGRD